MNKPDKYGAVKALAHCLTAIGLSLGLYFSISSEWDIGIYESFYSLESKVQTFRTTQNPNEGLRKHTREAFANLSYQREKESALSEKGYWFHAMMFMLIISSVAIQVVSYVGGRLCKRGLERETSPPFGGVT